jgi:tetratricopeptide (TPR) repeat protein
LRLAVLLLFRGKKSMTKQNLLNKGFQYFAQMDYERAIIFFEKAIQLDDTFEIAYSGLSESLNRLGRIDEAIPVVKKWIDLNGDDPIAHTALSRLYVQKGMRDKAEEEMALSVFLSKKQEN